jgi:predicted  nucleic acid-binding Zn-ribbon protein
MRMAFAEHSESLRLIARETRELKQTVRALRGEIEKTRRDGEVRLQCAVDAANGEILHLRATIRRLRKSLDTDRTGEHQRPDGAAVGASAEILSLETTFKKIRGERRVKPHATEPTTGCAGSIVDRHAFAEVHAVQRAGAPAGRELAELRETIVQLRDRLDRANDAWEEKMKAIESVGRSRRRELEETIKILREQLQRASAEG